MKPFEPVRQALDTVVQATVAWAPSLLTALLILLFGWVLATVLRTVTRRLARRAGIDRAAERSGLAESMSQAEILGPLSVIVGRLVFWVVLLGFAALALDNLGLALTVLPLRSFFSYVPKIFAALVLLVLGALIAQLAGRAVQVALAGLGVDIHRGLGRATRALLLVLTVVIAVDQLGFDVSLLSSVIGTFLAVGAGAFALAFALGARGVARNVLAGYYARESLKVGDRVEIEGRPGTLESIGTVSSQIVDDHGSWLVPNTRLTEEVLRIGPPD